MSNTASRRVTSSKSNNANFRAKSYQAGAAFIGDYAFRYPAFSMKQLYNVSTNTDGW